MLITKHATARSQQTPVSACPFYLRQNLYLQMMFDKVKDGITPLHRLRVSERVDSLIDSILKKNCSKKKRKSLPHILGITRNLKAFHFFLWETKVMKCSQPWQFEQIKIKSYQWWWQDLWWALTAPSWGFLLCLHPSLWASLSVIGLQCQPRTDCNNASIE